MIRRPCWVEISPSAFEHNYRLLVETCQPKTCLLETCRENPGSSPHPRTELLAIVKADAYGHGLSICAAAAARTGAAWLGVTSIEEGVAARDICKQAGFPDTQILAIAGPFLGQCEAAIRAKLTAVVWEPWQLQLLDTAARTAGCDEGTVPIHLELDTGMSRQGVGATELESLLATLRHCDRLRLDGLMTHLYAADEQDGAATRAQFELLERMIAKISEAGLLQGRQPLWLHVGNSAAVLAGHALLSLEEVCRRWGLRPMARPGLALYGLAPEFAPNQPERVTMLRNRVRRVLEWKSQVVGVRSIAPGQVVGYNGTFVATEPMRVALLAVGYGDGLSRALSNRGSVLIAGCRAPIVGRISMDQTVVDVTDIPHVAPGDEVVLLGRQAEKSITAEDHASWAGTIPWEIFTSITARVERRTISTASGKPQPAD